MTQSVKLSKRLEHPFKSVSEPLAYANDIVNGKLDNSKKENEFIYHEKVPDLDTLQEIKARILIIQMQYEYKVFVWVSVINNVFCK